MRIGFDAKRAFQNHRGLGNYSRNLIDGLAGYFPENEYILYGRKPGRGELLQWTDTLPPQVKISEPASKSKVYAPLWRSYFVNNEIASDQLNIYHGLSHEIPLKKGHTQTKYIVTVHDLLFLRFKQNFTWTDRQIYLSKIKYSCKNADLVLAVSEQTKADLINFLNVPEEKIKVAYQSCSTLYYKEVDNLSKNAVRQKYRLPDDFLLFVGALVKHKNIDRIIEAVALLPEETKLPLVIVGRSNSYKKQLLEVVSKFQLDNKVIFLDYVDIADMPAIYQLAKMLVWPSLFEGFGIPIVEALFSKLPVITSNVGCFSEVGGKGSVYVDPNNSEEISKAIHDILTNRSLSAKMQQVGVEYAQKFHIQNTTARLIDLYSSL